MSIQVLPIGCYVALGGIILTVLGTNGVLLAQIKSNRSRNRSAISAVITFVALADIGTALVGIPFAIKTIAISSEVSLSQQNELINVSSITSERHLSPSLNRRSLRTRGHIPACLIVLFRTTSAMFQACHVTYRAVSTRGHATAPAFLNWTTSIVIVPGFLVTAGFICQMPFMGIGAYDRLSSLLVEDVASVIGGLTVSINIVLVDGLIICIACVAYIVVLGQKALHSHRDSVRENELENKIQQNPTDTKQIACLPIKKSLKETRFATDLTMSSYSCPDLFMIHGTSSDACCSASVIKKDKMVDLRDLPVSKIPNKQFTKHLKRSKTLSTKINPTVLSDRCSPPTVSIRGPFNRTRKLGVSSNSDLSNPSSLKRRKYINQPLMHSQLKTTSLTSFENDSSVFESSPRRKVSTRRSTITPIKQAPQTSTETQKFRRKHKSLSVTDNETVVKNRAKSIRLMHRHLIRNLVATCMYCVVFTSCIIPHSVAVVLDQMDPVSTGCICIFHLISVILVYASTIPTTLYTMYLCNNMSVLKFSVRQTRF